jgi:hypothetical protein
MIGRSPGLQEEHMLFRSGTKQEASPATPPGDALRLSGRSIKARAAVAIAIGGSCALTYASPALAGSLDYDPATRTMTYTGGPGPDVPKWGDPDAQGNILISDAVPMEFTAAVDQNCAGSPTIIICPAVRVVADLRGGDDRTRGGSTNDVLLGGDGNDLRVGGGGADRIDGGAGDDDLSPQRDTEDFAGDGADELIGGPGTDLVTYRQVGGAQRISLNDVADDGRDGEGDNVHSDVENVISASSADVILGSEAANVIDGGTGNNAISGGAGNDTLSALGGDDVLSGDAGDDSLAGNGGRNILDGGTGFDRFGRSAFSCTFGCSLGVDEFRADDGVRESIDCSGVAGSKAIVDALDTVANCTTVTRSLTGGNRGGANPSITPVVTCRPPKLRGKTLAAAKTALKKAHCKLGKVTKPKKVKRGAQLIVKKQSGRGPVKLTLVAAKRK